MLLWLSLLRNAYFNGAVGSTIPDMYCYNNQGVDEIQQDTELFPNDKTKIEIFCTRLDHSSKSIFDFCQHARAFWEPREC